MLPQNQKIMKRRRFGEFETREQQRQKMLVGLEMLRPGKEKDEHNDTITEINSKIKQDNMFQIQKMMTETGDDALQKGHTAEMITHVKESDYLTRKPW